MKPTYDDARVETGRRDNTEDGTTGRIIPLRARRRNCAMCGIAIDYGTTCDTCAAWADAGEAIARAAAALRRARR